MSIKSIDKKSVHRICSGQVVLNLAIAVKELVENSLDAGATNIVVLKENGSELLQVIDNGSGIEESNFHEIGAKHSTSKLVDFSDLTSVDTFGFRGEALSSLCSLSSVSITTRHRGSDIGYQLELSHEGSVAKKSQVARSVGTTVSLKNVFSTLPVRHKEFLRNQKKELTKMIQMLTSYCLIQPEVKFACSNSTKTGKKTILLLTQGNSSVKDNITNIFGPKQMSSVIEFKTVAPSEEILEEFNLTNTNCGNSPFSIEGYLSTCEHTQGRSSNDRQFIFVNKRPCELIKVLKIINEVYHSNNRHQYPFVLLNISLNKDQVDINVTPDKRTIFLEHEKLLIATIKASLLKLYENVPSTMSHSIMSFFESPKSNASNSSPSISSPPIDFTSLKRKASPQSESEIKLPKLINIDDNISNSSLSRSEISEFGSGVDNNASMDPISRSEIDNAPTNEENTLNATLPAKVIPSPTNLMEKLLSLRRSLPSKESPLSVDKLKPKSLTSFFSSQPTRTSKNLISHSPKGLASEELNIVEPDTIDLSQHESFSTHNEVTIIQPVHEEMELVNSQVEIVGTRDPGLRKNVVARFSMEFLRARSKKQREDHKLLRRFRAKINQGDNDTAEQELKRELHKEHFKEMEIIGQFNLGFIITKRDSDLFIVDQHATDEKYNYEMLQRNTVLETQKLFTAQKLELTAVNESILLEHIDVFNMNGFQFAIDHEAIAGQKVSLQSIPLSKNWTFGKSDIEELIFMLSDTISNGSTFRPSKLNAMFASRACRKSVMIGTALSIADMKKLVLHMGEIEQPWNCPHGRPTIRHLVNLLLTS